MRTKSKKPDNEIFIKLVEYLEANNQELNKKKIGERIGITGQRISYIKAGTPVTKLELLNLQEAFKTELQDFDPTATKADDPGEAINQLQDRVQALEQQMGTIRINEIEFQEMRRLIMKLAEKLL